MELPRFYEFSSVKRNPVHKLTSINRSNITIWKPFRTEIGTKFENWNLENLSDLKELDMDELIKTMNSIRPNSFGNDFFDSTKGLYSTAAVALVIGIVIIIILLKITIAWSREH